VVKVLGAWKNCTMINMMMELYRVNVIMSKFVWIT